MEGQQVEISRESSVMIGRVSLWRNSKETFGQHDETRLNRLIITDVRDKEAKWVRTETSKINFWPNLNDHVHLYYTIIDGFSQTCRWKTREIPQKLEMSFQLSVIYSLCIYSVWMTLFYAFCTETNRMDFPWLLQSNALYFPLSVFDVKRFASHTVLKIRGDVNLLILWAEYWHSFLPWYPSCNDSLEWPSAVSPGESLVLSFQSWDACVEDQTQRALIVQRRVAGKWDQYTVNEHVNGTLPEKAYATNYCIY